MTHARTRGTHSPLVTASDVARLAGVSKGLVTRWLAHDYFPHIRTERGTVVCLRRDVQDFLAERAVRQS